jgi:hypothetical protein
MRAVLSSEAVTTRVPSGLNAARTEAIFLKPFCVSDELDNFRAPASGKPAVRTKLFQFPAQKEVK